jgi:hypothetical protein
VITMSKVFSNHPRDLDRPTHDAGATVSARRRSLLTRKTYVRSLLMTGAMGIEGLPETIRVSVTGDSATPHSGGINLKLPDEGTTCTLCP